ncbi:hypothetical protein OGAPHI_004835 [Ogataea philodendri]|uniref:Uncharacterized protein n=1 Tax=Ogataea philodendri TaxID=1378263 RepID=A0A9P8P315_9ASCO|nr:uncharacterized protein OGAPHI_004835 [Ogataea philodendri]KAH3664121.1 hypothetical protein OGAPHI_004835 [Ogataea philodendri]
METAVSAANNAKFGLLPWNVTNTNSVCTNVDDHKHHNNVSPVADLVSQLDRVVFELERNIVEGDSVHDKCNHHDRQGHQEHSSAADLVNDEESNHRQNKIGSRHNDGNSGGVVETNGFENGGRKVHERVETGELLDTLQSTGNNKCSEVGWNSVDLFDTVPCLGENRVSGRNDRQTNLDSPAVVDMGKTGTNTISDQLTTGDSQTV